MARAEPNGTLLAVRVTLCDVGPRDGLQNESETLAPDVRADLVRRLAAAGLPRIEAVSFVSDERVPQMAGAEDVVVGVGEVDAELSRARPERARLGAAGGDRPRPGQRHLGGDRDLQPAQRERVARGGGRTRRADPGRGRPAGDARRSAARSAARSRALSILASSRTSPSGSSPRARARSCSRTRSASRRRGRWRGSSSASRSSASPSAATSTTLATPASRARGRRSRPARRCSTRPSAGLGGCPFAPRATGNVSTEDVLYLLERERVETGVDLDALIAVARWLEELLGRELPGRVYRA